MKNKTIISGCGIMFTSKDLSQTDSESDKSESDKKEYVKPKTKVIDIESDEEVMHSSNWYNRHDHGHQHQNHDDQDNNGNHNGWNNPNNPHNSDWDD